MSVEINTCVGAEVAPWLADAARLRIEVFREFPYLYDGNEDSERAYLTSYAKSERSVFVLVLRGGEVVGVSTGLPLLEAAEAFQEPFREAGWNLEEVFYFGESVLRRDLRGGGIGHRFFDEREAHAARHGFKVTAFCAVDREPDHPLQPEGYQPLDKFWERRGYRREHAMVAALNWRQVDAGAEVENRLTFWTRRLDR
jgi:GNAT superfamily N-acetyltransferase